MHPYALLQILGLVMIGFAGSEVTVTTGRRISPSNSEECSRTCEDGEEPRVCYYHFTIEYYVTMNRACELCTPNNTNQISTVPQCQCIEADGFERGMLSINRMLPGPSIQVCQNDKIVVDVRNNMAGMEASLHWHGLWQQGSQYYDGVPFLTQCPISSTTTFRYQFVASNPGTHFYHSHSGMQKMDGQYGSLIVRQTPSTDPHAKLYDHDLPTHVILISDWMHEVSIARFPGRFKNHPEQLPENVLINGKGQWKDPTTNKTTSVQLESFVVESGKRYRFRFINSFSSTCPTEITVEGHSLTLIAQDGTSVVPVAVNTIISSSGERADFILNANQTVGAYWIQVRALHSCAKFRISQLAVLRYAGGPETPGTRRPDYQVGLTRGILYNPLDGSCEAAGSGSVCPDQLKSVALTPEELLKPRPDHRIILPYEFFVYRNLSEDIFKTGYYPRFMVDSSGNSLLGMVDGISFKFPRVPPLSQSLNSSDTCNRISSPHGCGTPCQCPHTHHIRKGEIVEVLVYDNDPPPKLAHSFHLHGYSFHLLKIGRFSNGTDGMKSDVDSVVKRHQTKLDEAGYRQLAGKDTVTIPTFGYVIFRFKADNPGWWLFHCHFMYHVGVGMSVVFHVGEKEDLPPVPPAFPTCYSSTPEMI